MSPDFQLLLQEQLIGLKEEVDLLRFKGQL